MWSFSTLLSFTVCMSCFRYVPTTVDHSDDLACSGTYLLHQGIQRRLQITIVHEAGGEYMWRDVTELVAGRIRTTPEWRTPDGGDHNDDVLSLSLLPAHYIQRHGDDRVFFRFEAAWDSSLHNSPLLNRITPYGERVYMTISAYLDVSSCLIIISLNQRIFVDPGLEIWKKSPHGSVKLTIVWHYKCAQTNGSLCTVYTFPKLIYHHFIYRTVLYSFLNDPKNVQLLLQIIVMID